MRYTARAAMLVAVTMAMLAAAPVRAAPIPSSDTDYWGHFGGCFMALLDSVTHTQYCGPSAVPFNNDSLTKSDQSPPPPPPSCGPCTNGASIDATNEILVAELSDHWMPRRPARLGWLLLACCPINNS